MVNSRAMDTAPAPAAGTSLRDEVKAAVIWRSGSQIAAQLVAAGIALVQLCLAPVAADYYRQPVLADLLRLQALIFLATPFIALPEALLVRELDFKRPALANLSATFVSATVAITCALGGFGVWTLVYAPLAFFWTRA